MNITMKALAEELDITTDMLARHLIEDQDIPDLNGWEDGWMLHDAEADAARDHFKGESDD